MSADTYPYDVFLSHSAKDKAVVPAPSLSASNGERFLPNGISRFEPLNRSLVGRGVLTAPPRIGGIRVVGGGLRTARPTHDGFMGRDHLVLPTLAPWPSASSPQPSPPF